MQLKKYQQATLDTLDSFFARALATGPAEAFRRAVEEQEQLARLEGRTLEPRTYQPLVNGRVKVGQRAAQNVATLGLG